MPLPLCWLWKSRTILTRCVNGVLPDQSIDEHHHCEDQSRLRWFYFVWVCIVGTIRWIYMYAAGANPLRDRCMQTTTTSYILAHIYAMMHTCLCIHTFLTHKSRNTYLHIYMKRSNFVQVLNYALYHLVVETGSCPSCAAATRPDRAGDTNSCETIKLETNLCMQGSCICRYVDWENIKKHVNVDFSSWNAHGKARKQMSTGWKNTQIKETLRMPVVCLHIKPEWPHRSKHERGSTRTA
jgi:hypothetical protein